MGYEAMKSQSNTKSCGDYVQNKRYPQRTPAEIAGKYGK
jgi:hypothetical protein